MKQKKFIYLLCAFLILFVSCGDNRKGFFSLQSQKKAYLKKLKKINVSLAQAWDSTGNYALQYPLLLENSYAEITIPQNLDATGFQMNLQPGEKISISLKDTVRNNALFSSLYIKDTLGNYEEILKPDTTRTFFEHATMHEQDIVLLIHPTVNFTHPYAVKIQKNPSLAWPVTNTNYSNIGSFWGVDRDGGARRHEGVDIFAPRGRDVIAVADGRIRRTGTNNLGGKVIFLRPNNMQASVYYAHLDSQYVVAGDIVKTGDVIGAVGNTGNAITTPPHLHFGIYAIGGAINPLLFIREKTQVSFPENVDADKIVTTNINNLTYYNKPGTNGNKYTSNRGDTFYLKGVSNDYYRMENNNGEIGFAPIKNWKGKFNN